MGRVGGGGFRGGRHFHHPHGAYRGGGSTFRHGRMGVARRLGGFHRVGFHARYRNRYHHYHTLHRTYFRGRRLRYYWGARRGYYPVQFYETDEFRAEAIRQNAVPTVLPRTLAITLVPYEATGVTVPAGVGPGQIFQFGQVFVVGPANATPGMHVQLMVPPATLPSPTDRVDVLVNLNGTAATPAAQPTIDTNNDGIPDATPFVPGQDAYITVTAQQGVPDSVLVYVPSTSILALNHVVDAVTSWGEVQLARRTEADGAVLDTDFQVDMVQVGQEGAGPRWEHQTFVNTSIPEAPRVVTVVVPANCAPGSLFTLGTELTGAAEPMHVRVPDGLSPGEQIEVVIPPAATVPEAEQQVPDVNSANPNAWAAPEGFDFFSEAQRNGFRLTMGALEVTVRAQMAAAAAHYNQRHATAVCCRIVVYVVVFLVVVGIIVGVSVGISGGGNGDDKISDYDGQYCSSYYGLSPSCEECPTTPVGESTSYCWEDNAVTWASMSTAVQNNWGVLGYTASIWHSNTLPSTSNDCWNELSSSEQSAAAGLGYDALLWNYPYRC